jgi:hypothetical protein
VIKQPRERGGHSPRWAALPEKIINKYNIYIFGGIIPHHPASSHIIPHHPASSRIIPHHPASSCIIPHHPRCVIQYRYKLSV